MGDSGMASNHTSIWVLDCPDKKKKKPINPQHCLPSFTASVYRSLATCLSLGKCELRYAPNFSLSKPNIINTMCAS